MVEVLTAPLDQAVAVDEDGLVGAMGCVATRALPAAGTENQGLRGGDHLDLAARVNQQRLGVSGVDDADLAPVGVDDAVDHGDELFEVPALEDPVQAAHHGLGIGVDGDQGADGRAHLGHRRGGLDTPAHHIADEERCSTTL